MTTEDKMREEFEAWCVKEIELPEGYDLNWNNDTVRLMYRGWAASRDSLVIELPNMIGMNQPFTGTPISEIRAHNHFNDAIARCRESIHAAGVKTK